MVDIGGGESGGNGTLNILDDSVVFSKNDMIQPASISANHIYERAASAEVIDIYGPLPSSWSGSSDLVIYVPNNVTYKTNGGSGTTEDSSRPHPSGNATAANNNFTRSGYTFVNWNTEADGGGTTYRE